MERAKPIVNEDPIAVRGLWVWRTKCPVRRVWARLCVRTRHCYQLAKRLGVELDGDTIWLLHRGRRYPVPKTATVKQVEQVLTLIVSERNER
jgi:hypothetical protein